ncbi:sucrase ferredoxin [Salinibacter grassmerensis]|uniref:sucrase ferredoxin n=1 Tax=Salinibacter grassmerensis TaxID=3040353 RepID=UPI0021E88450|nr:sucrase ferredoxin [Salinibacter grassmerensis]
MASDFCSRLARSHDVSPTGTATEAAHWLLIEDPSPWSTDAVEDADWGPSVHGAIAGWTDTMPDLRVQLIRRGLERWDDPGRIRCIAVRSGPRPVVREWSLGAYEDIPALQVPEALRASGPATDAGPLVLTCVNGRRDACCAKWGRPVARAMADTAPEAAWQTSHLGGHRFAPTALVLPHGTHYGWLRPDDMADLVAAHRRGHLHDLDRVRGAVHQPRPVQAACLSLRRRLGTTALSAVQGVGAEKTDAQWTVRVRAADETRMAHVWQEQRGTPFPHSCGSREAKPETDWHVRWEGDETARP